jgi:hypothetical protein
MAMEGSLQEILECLLAGQQEMNARHERANAELKAAQAEMKADINTIIEAGQERANAELKAAQAEMEARADAGKGQGGRQDRGPPQSI